MSHQSVDRNQAQRCLEVVYGFGERHGCRRIENDPFPLYRDIFLGNEMTLDDMPRAHRLEHRPQTVIERKNMSDAPAGCYRQDRFTGERKLRENIQHAFQETGISSLEDWRRENDSARLLHSSERGG